MTHVMQERKKLGKVLDTKACSKYERSLTYVWAQILSALSMLGC